MKELPVSIIQIINNAAINYLLNKGIISANEADRLMKMTTSSDEESILLADLITDKYYEQIDDYYERIDDKYPTP
jgi:hypothetical protein